MEKMDISDADLSKMNAFFTVQLKIRVRQAETDGKVRDRYMRTHFRKCTVEDFEDKGIILSDDEKSEYQRRICPELYPVR
jgi:hypothetical protein